MITVNGRSLPTPADPRLTLADWLRQELRLTGTKLGCEHGVCGVCTVIRDNRAARACLLLASRCDGSSIVTIEGLSAEHPERSARLMTAFKDAFQCGFCASGWLCLTFAQLEQGGSNTDAEETLAANLCRCTGYASLRAAITLAINGESSL